MKHARLSTMFMAGVGAFIVLIVLPAFAAELTDADRRYLRSEYGLGRHDETVATMDAAQRERLHALINDPQLKDVPTVRHDRVAAYLFDVHMQRCQETGAQHPGSVCPPAVDAKIEPGKDIADQQCNFCHLFGVGRAPSFYKLAGRQSWDADTLAQAQRRGHENARGYGHQMSPIGLTREQFEALAVYIGSLKAETAGVKRQE